MNAKLLERYRNVLPGFLSPYYAEPIEIDRGEGSWVFDGEGNKYLDFFGGVLTTMIGHNHPRVTAAIQEQAGKVLHTSTLYLSEPMIALAERIAGLSGIPNPRVFLTPSGTEANDTAILLATSYRKSNQMLAMRNSYHGRSFTAQAITSHTSWGATSHSGLKVTFVQGPYRLRSPFRDLDGDAYTKACTEDLLQLLDMTGAGDVAGLIAEPIQGVGGFATPPDGFFGSMKKELDNRGILYISDEVQTGWGRTGEHFWGYQAHDIVPDMLTFAKGVGNGITLAGIVARAEIFETINVAHFSTFGGNPLSSAAGLATINEVVEQDLQGNALRRGQQLRAVMDELAETHDWIVEARGRGLMQAIETVEPNTLQPSADRSVAFMEACKAEGLLIGKGGLYGNVLRITPMLNVTEDEMTIGTDALKAAASKIT
ncbi:MAG: aspartate aminotransferase family protein [Acidimicrobiales bacterium]|nr:aspartate aminotransferase family protein [Acidimicrobiales bacterium]